ncbi:polymeric immunoglobulin receptor-like isoform X2 [Cebidichthys violaceus]|uniref:polymeric immunoglobulin receptor-like isoform X2 n=1 Tax=Cebidichthys violaceus TaxID=271503 RepID=UPI0035CBD747
MEVHHSLICFFLLSLQDGNNGLVKAQVYTGTEGGNVRVQCSSSYSYSGSRKFLCKEPCKQKYFIIETTDVRAQKGRFSIEWSSIRDVSVTITQLTKSDSGWYRCGSGSSYQQFEIIVVDALLDGDPSEETTFYSRPGGNILVECSFTTSETRKYFCKGQCENKDSLVETTGFTAQRGRYSIRYVKGYPSGGFVYVGITQLTRSDSGQYWCRLDKPFSLDSYRGFNIVVTDAPPTSEPNQAMTSSVPSASTATTTQSLSSTSGSSSASSASPETIKQSKMTTRDVLLYVGLALVFLVVLSLSVLLFCRRRTSKPRERPVETQYADVTEANRVYEDIREDRQSRSPPVEMSSTVYSLVTAVNLQNTAEDDLSGLTYSEVTFSNRAAGLSNSGVRGDDDVIYSVPRVETLRDEDDPYSTVNGELRG